MSRFTGSKYKKSRRLGFSILETGKELAKKPYIPGEHGHDRRKKSSDYGVQLNEKQKVKFMYGLNERSFKRLFEKSGKLKGVHGENFLKLLESRLDNIVYRLGYSNTRSGARQLVNHGHILVNGKKESIPSFEVKPGNVISLREASTNHKAVLEALELKKIRIAFVSFDEKKNEGTYLRYPERNELNADVNESLIVEFYNR